MPITRLAPSPTGALHLGNARTFLINWLLARQRNWKIILRIEDLDGPRIKAGADKQAIEDLQWLGLDWDEGPIYQSSRTEKYTAAISRLLAAKVAYPCICSRSEVAHAASAPHAEDASSIYPGTCRGKFKSMEEAQQISGRPPALRFAVAALTGDATFKFQFDPDFREAAAARNQLVAELEKRRFSEDAIFQFKLSLEEVLIQVIKLGHPSNPFRGVTIDCQIKNRTVNFTVTYQDGQVSRFDISDSSPHTSAQVQFTDEFAGPQQFDVAAQLGDFVIAKNDGTPAYQLAVVVDDAEMGVTDIVRGDDLLDSTPRQILLYEALGLKDKVPNYYHLPLIKGPDGRRLAKRHGDTRLSYYRNLGVPPSRILTLLARWSGIPEADNITHLLNHFDLSKVPRQSITFTAADDAFLKPK